jgi:hypothetical protein
MSYTQENLAAVNHLHANTALRLRGKAGARAAFAVAQCGTQLRYLTAAEEAELHSQLDARVQKILGIMAVMINDAEADLAAMNDLIEIIRFIDDRLFDFAAERCPRRTIEALLTSYLEKTA